MDFETYSEAGYVFDVPAVKWRSIVSSPPHGLGAVGASVYTEHPSAEVLSLAYNFKDGTGPRLWVPGMPPPDDLFEHFARGLLMEAWNSAFEYYVWKNICVTKMGWPDLPYWLLRDAMAKARAFSLPGKLGEAGKAINAPVLKQEDGTRLLNKFSKPRQPTKKDPRLRILPADDPEDAQKLYGYNLGDIDSESAVSALCPDLSDEELQLWIIDQAINFRGIQIDGDGVKDCLAIIRQAQARYNEELRIITGGSVEDANKLDALKAWLATRGLHTDGLKADVLEDLLKIPLLPPDVRRALEIRDTLGASSVKKLYAIDRRTSRDGRLRDLFAFCGADRTGRWAGRGPQPQNLPNSGPKVRQCDPVSGCGRHYKPELDSCPWCGTPGWASSASEWGIEALEDALLAMKGHDLYTVESIFGDATATVSACLRGLFSAGPGKDLICSDYSAIEAVVLAMLAGEQWRIDVFRTHGKIYEMSASKISGVPFEDFLKHKAETGNHHPLRKSLGKLAELAGGYQGGVGAYKQFGADEHFDTDDQILEAVRAWRKASPNIVKFWYGMEDAARAAIKDPANGYEYRGIVFHMRGDVLYCKLLSGRRIAYHQPRLHWDRTPWGRQVEKITYMGYNSDYKKGSKGWMRLDTYGGKLTENVVQATARDILAHALVGLERAGYPVVLHVHDEAVAEVPEGWGSVEQFEAIMADLPLWAKDWPIKAAGGWRGKRYRKD
jgi:DNA polymerase